MDEIARKVLQDNLVEKLNTWFEFLDTEATAEELAIAEEEPLREFAVWLEEETA